MSPVAERAHARWIRSEGFADLSGLLLLGVLVTWTFVAAAGRSEPTSPDPVWQLAIAAAAAYAVGRAGGAAAPVLTPAAIAAAAFAWFVVTPHAFSGDAAAGPLGYANANAALLVQAVAAVGIASVVTRDVRTRQWLLVGGVVLCVATGVTRSTAGVVLAVGVLLTAAVVAPGVRRRAPVLMGCAILMVGAVLVTLVVASGHAGRTSETAAADALSSKRVSLWHDALQMTAADPLRGVGPGRFPVESSVARVDGDTTQAHSAVLQQSAEQGVIGGLLLLMLFGWALFALWRSEQPNRVVMIAAAAITALVVHSTVDYVLSFPVVVMAAAALLGVGTARHH